MSFVNSFFLYAVGAMVLPVLFHFVRKMRAKKVQFGSLMFLSATPKQLIKKRRLKDLLLMATRALILGLLAFGFARPFLPPDFIPFVSREENESIVILLDNSYSMGAEDVFDRAKRESLARIDAADRNDEIAIIVFSDYPQQLTSFEAEREVHRNVVGSAVSVSSRGTDFFEPLRMAADVLAAARHRQKRVVLVSDFQQPGWSAQMENWKLPPEVIFDPLKVSTGDSTNAFVDAFNVGVRRTGDNVAVRFDARIATAGTETPAANNVQLSIGGVVVDRQDLPLLDVARWSFEQFADDGGIYQGELAITEDKLDVDNRFYFTYVIDEKPSVLVISGSASRSTRDGFFLGKAFDIGQDSPYRFSVGGRQQLTRSAIAADLLFLTNVPSVTAAEAAALKTFVESGGQVVISAGDRVDTGSLSQLLQELGLGTVERIVVPRSTQGADAIIAQVDLHHPVFSAFSGIGRSAILRPKFRKYMQVIADSNATVIARFDTGDPFLVERHLGQGNVLMYASTFSTEWTNLAINEMYVPFVYQLAKYAVESNSARHQFIVGDVVALTGQAGEEWEVLTPGGDVFNVDVDESGKGFFRETEVPGHYVAMRRSVRFPFSVNVDTRESDLTSRDESEAYAAVVSASSAQSETQEIAGVAGKDERDQKMWRLVLLVVIGLFALETVLANRPARRGSSQPKR